MVKKSVVPDALKLKTCKSKVRRGSRIEPCNRDYLPGTLNNPKQCPDKSKHMLPFLSGFCHSGWHEGTKALDGKGNPAPTCKLYMTCPCDCHTKLFRLFEITGKERILVDSSGYVRPPRNYWMPEDDPTPILSRGSDVVAPVFIESPAPDRVPATLGRTFAPTPTGRAARGQLEAWVKTACDVWLVDEPGFPCTPVYLSEEISREEGIAKPSVGAISAVFERWVKIGFAEIEKKPTRFMRYTDEGIELGLEKLKERVKRHERLKISDDKRNLRRV